MIPKEAKSAIKVKMMLFDGNYRQKEIFVYFFIDFAELKNRDQANTSDKI